MLLHKFSPQTKSTINEELGTLHTQVLGVGVKTQKQFGSTQDKEDILISVNHI